ncbi:hypothetical protein Salat_2780500 [Sesamum alatum]|uniref:Myb/SANT-like domain-containing protein n=1 Tax=Sesamum alatum TaxID=300844 RepID=A0AAE1XKQ5_9LAMI|nr:hypothetical protein Salat_2780500 [Sesamum alatum]
MEIAPFSVALMGEKIMELGGKEANEIDTVKGDATTRWRVMGGVAANAQCGGNCVGGHPKPMREKLESFQLQLKVVWPSGRGFEKTTGYDLNGAGRAQLYTPYTKTSCYLPWLNLQYFGSSPKVAGHVVTLLYFPEGSISCHPLVAHFTLSYCAKKGSSKPHGCRVKADKPNTRCTWTQREEEKNYGTLTCMMAKSGFGWDDSRCMITVDTQDIWDEFCKDVVDNETQDCYVPTTEWCPDVGHVGNENGTAGDTQANVDVNVTSTASHKKLGARQRKERRKAEKRSSVYEVVGKVLAYRRMLELAWGGLMLDGKM